MPRLVLAPRALRDVKRLVDFLLENSPQAAWETGEILLEEFLVPMGLSQYRLAKEIGVPAQRISEIVAGKRSITADTDLRLCRFFGLSNGYWLRAQAAHDTTVASCRRPRMYVEMTVPGAAAPPSRRERASRRGRRAARRRNASKARTGAARSRRCAGSGSIRRTRALRHGARTSPS